jgi:translation initiation factor 2 subunit 2
MELLERVYRLMEENGQMVNNIRPTRLSIPPPQLSRAGRKVIWGNFAHMCEKLGRPVDHVKMYLDRELCTRSTLKANNAMAMKLRIRPNQLMDLLYKYSKQFIICGMCKGIDTVLEKDSVTRIMFLKCHSCHSKRSTAPFF